MMGGGMMGGGTDGRPGQGMMGGSSGGMGNMSPMMMGMMNKDMMAQMNMMIQMNMMMQMNMMIAEMHQMTSDCDHMMNHNSMMAHTGKAPGTTAKPPSPTPKGE